MGSRIGVLKIAAQRIGVPFEVYMHNISLGLKYCTGCKKWLGRELYQVDNSRGDKLKATCKKCCSTNTQKVPLALRTKMKALALRTKMKALGFDYCRKCAQWLPKDSVRGGICNTHQLEEDRTRYATYTTYRLNRRQHAHARKRKVAPIPGHAQERIMEAFNNECAYCDQTATTWDHVIPISQGGETKPWNMVPACATCNSSKKDQDVQEWLTKTGKVPKEQFYDVLLLEHLLPS